MSGRINLSLNLKKIGDAVRAGHSAVKIDKNGNKFLSVTVWVNSETDQYGNDSSIQLNSTKEKQAEEPKVYVGNGKSTLQPAEPVAKDATVYDHKAAIIDRSKQNADVQDDLPF